MSDHLRKWNRRGCLSAERVEKLSMKILVTGASGYLGKGIVRHLLDKGHRVIATGRKIDEIDPRAERIACDLFSINFPFREFGEPDVLLHLAWRDGFVHYSDAHINDLPKHYKFIQNMVSDGIKKVVGMGSMHEVGFYEGSIHDNTPCNPITPYGISKNALRELTKTACEKNNVLFQWLRGFYIVGNSQYGSSVFSKISLAEAEGKKEFPFTTGRNQFDFLDYEDFCEQVAQTVGQNEVLGIINICSGYPERLADRVERFISDNGYRIKLKYGEFPDRPYDSKAVWGDASKIKIIMKNENYS